MAGGSPARSADNTIDNAITATIVRKMDRLDIFRPFKQRTASKRHTECAYTLRTFSYCILPEPTGRWQGKPAHLEMGMLGCGTEGGWLDSQALLRDNDALEQ